MAGEKWTPRFGDKILSYSGEEHIVTDHVFKDSRGVELVAFIRPGMINRDVMTLETCLEFWKPAHDPAVASLCEAARPFAEAYEEILENYKDFGQTVVWDHDTAFWYEHDPVGRIIIMGDLRKLTEALAPFAAKGGAE